MFVISAIGTIGVFSNGFEQRFSKNDLVILNQYTDGNKYVNSRFDNYEINFDANPQTKNIMIIGDSFGEDLINAIFEANLNRNASISTKKIQTHCGNLYIEKDNSIKSSDFENLEFNQEILKINNEDYYYSNVIARASKTMFECKTSKANFKSTGTEG